jgi:tRNA (cytidine/uridine-2'-O-)-methyltransferase
MNIVLHEPEIPMNTGNIGRTCVAAGAALHLIRPLGFLTDEKSIRRSGLDYWRDLEVQYYDHFQDFLERTGPSRLFMVTTKAERIYTDVSYGPDDYIMFGKESAGIPEEILLRYRETAIRIPMMAPYRSLNLANAAAIVLYEALRQNRFAGMLLKGQLHRHRW